METNPTKRIRKQKLSGGLLLKLTLVMLSFVQAHWVPIACAAGTITAASLFGEKAYWIGIGKKTEKIILEKTSLDTVAVLESQISEYKVWRLENTKYAEYTDEFLPELFFQLARAQESEGVSSGKFIANYKKAVSSNKVGGYALARLHGHISMHEYKKLVTDNIGTFPGRFIASQFEQIGNWPAFKDFVEVVFEEMKDPIQYAKSFESGLTKNGIWHKEYSKLCRLNPHLLKYVYEKDIEKAEVHIRQGNFAKAADIYETILNASGNDMDTSRLELTLYETTLHSGKYRETLVKLNSFIEKYRSVNRELVQDALLIKGRTYIQLGEFGEAIDKFYSLMIEYPESGKAPEANFFIGYCYMLQGQFDNSREAFELVINDYPQSSYANRARLALVRIEAMTDK